MSPSHKMMMRSISVSFDLLAYLIKSLPTFSGHSGMLSLGMEVEFLRERGGGGRRK